MDNPVNVQEALNVLSHVVYNHGVVLFASTDPRHDFVIQKTARLSGEYFITRQWYQGQFTNARHFYKTDKILPDIVIAMNLTRFQKVKHFIIFIFSISLPLRFLFTLNPTLSPSFVFSIWLDWSDKIAVYPF